MTKTKQIGSLALATAMLLPTVLTSCSVENTYLGQQVAVETTATEISPDEADSTEATNFTKDADYKEKIKALKDSIKSLDSSEYGAPYFTLDGINGEIFLSVSSDGSTINFAYTNSNGCQSVLHYDVLTKDKYLQFETNLKYKDGYALSYYTFMNVDGDEIYDIVDNFADTAKNGENDYGPFYEDTSEATRFSHDIKVDAHVLYERLILLMDYSLDELGYTKEELGINLTSFGSEYDPYQVIADEFKAEDINHTFEDGKCTDCNLYWAQCVGNTVMTLDNTYSVGESKAKIKSYDYPSFINPDVDYTYILYELDRLVSFEYCTNTYDEDPYKLSIGAFPDERMNYGHIVFCCGGTEKKNGDGSSYYIDGYTIICEGEYADIKEYLKDPATLRENCYYYYNDEYGSGSDLPDEVWDEYMSYLPTMIDAIEYHLNSFGYSLVDLGLID